jgi:drug/metabolite transporter (DMT)-like permease
MSDAAIRATSFISRCWTGAASKAWLLLGLTMLMWGGNVVASRLAVGQVSPMALVALRWILVCGLLTLMRRRHLAAEWAIVRPRWPLLLFMGISGFTGFNALFYAAGHLTSGVNIAIIQGGIPVFVLFGNRLIYGVRTSALQLAGLVLTMLGILVVGTRGDLLALGAMHWNVGDLMMLIAALLYASYTLALRYRPEVSALGFFTLISYAACLTSLPPLAFEIVSGTVQWPTLAGVLVIAYVALFPSFIGQLMYMHGVRLIGPARAGLFVNLLPVFGALLSVVVIREPFGVYHGVALALVLGGIFVAERWRRRI